LLVDIERRKAMASVRGEIKASLVKIGLEVFPVYEDERKGWSIEASDFIRRTPAGSFYHTKDELLFALVNLNISPEGQA